MINKPLWGIILLLAVVLAACMPGPAARPAAPTAAPTAPPAPTAATTAAAVGPTLPTASAGKARNVPTGVDAEGNFYRGNLDAPVKLVEFSDFQCPYCGRHAQQTDPLLEERYIATGKVVAFFRHFPLSQIHPAALPAARAAYCAGQQAPVHFWDMHDWLFANQALWANAANAEAEMRKAALALGVDGGRYDACVKDPQTDARIARDLSDGAARGVEGTPAFFINDWPLVGAYPFSEFEKVIAKAEQGLHPPPTPTPLPPNVQPYDENPGRP
ncbi:MAG: DsbA family protein, partial [Anaerolineae bacterium]